MFRKIAHVGVAVKDLDATVALYRDTLGFAFDGFDEVVDQGVKVAMFPVGESRIEFLAATRPDSPIAKHIEKKGEGIQHIAFAVDDIEAAIAALRARGVQMIDEKPRTGAAGHRIAFIHPRSAAGLLVELTQLAHGR